MTTLQHDQSASLSTTAVILVPLAVQQVSASDDVAVEEVSAWKSRLDGTFALVAGGFCDARPLPRARARLTAPPVPIERKTADISPRRTGVRLQREWSTPFEGEPITAPTGAGADSSPINRHGRFRDVESQEAVLTMVEEEPEVDAVGRAVDDHPGPDLLGHHIRFAFGRIWRVCHRRM